MSASELAPWTLRLMSMRRITAAVLPVFLAGCSFPATNGGSESAVGAVVESTRTGALPGANLAVGATLKHEILTHCGVESVMINGGWWTAVRPLYGPGGEGAGPPAGWDDPWQEGELTLEAEDRAVFAAVGERVVLTPSRVNEPLRTCR